MDSKCVTGHDKFVARRVAVDGLIGGGALASPAQFSSLLLNVVECERRASTIIA